MAPSRVVTSAVREIKQRCDREHLTEGRDWLSPGGWVMSAPNLKAEEGPATRRAFGRDGWGEGEEQVQQPWLPPAWPPAPSHLSPPAQRCHWGGDCPALGGALGTQAQRAPLGQCHPTAYPSASAFQEVVLVLTCPPVLVPKNVQVPAQSRMSPAPAICSMFGVHGVEAPGPPGSLRSQLPLNFGSSISTACPQ